MADVLTPDDLLGKKVKYRVANGSTKTIRKINGKIIRIYKNGDLRLEFYNHSAGEYDWKTVKPYNVELS